MSIAQHLIAGPWMAQAQRLHERRGSRGTGDGEARVLPEIGKTGMKKTVNH